MKIIIDKEYTTGKYTMIYLDKYDEVHEQEFDSVSEMEDEYNYQWSEGSWDFDFYTPIGQKFKLISTMKKENNNTK